MSISGSRFRKITKWLHQFLTLIDNKTNFEVVFVTCYQFSGLKQAGPYFEGSNGRDDNSKMLHYQRFFGPHNISAMGDAEKKRVLSDGFSEIRPLGGSDFFFLCLNDIFSQSESSI